MRWGKIILLFQAVVTLIIAMVFFFQLLSIDEAKIDELKVEMSKGHLIWGEDAPQVMVDLKQRYSIAAYVLLSVSIFELLLISRLVT